MTGAGITLAYPLRREHAPAGAAVREPSRRLPSSDSRTAAERKPAGRRIPVLLSSGAQLAGDGWKTHAWRCERECLETVEYVPTCAVGSRMGTLSGCSERARRRRSTVCVWCKRRLSSPAKRAGLLRATSRPDRATGVGSAERPPWGRLGACRGTARLHQDIFRAAGCHLALGAVAAVVEPGGASGVLEHAAVRMAAPAAPRQQRMYHQAVDSTSRARLASSPVPRRTSSPRLAYTATTTTWRRRAPTLQRWSRCTPGRSAGRPQCSPGDARRYQRRHRYNYLTTLGRDPAEDLELLADLAMPVKALSATL